MRLRFPARRTFWSANAILLYIALFKLTIHLLTSNRYGYFIDELYTIACGRHPAFGYADITPLVPILCRLSGLVLGYSLPAIRVLPALAGAVTVFVVGLTARRLGGGRFAQGLAAAAVALGPVWLSSNSFMAYDGFNLLMTALFFYVIAGILAGGDEPATKSWLIFGLVAGFGLLTKLSLLFYGFALALALLLTPHRRYYTRGGIWLAGVLALALLSPYLIWQHLHGWPVVEYFSHYKWQVNATSPLEFLTVQILTVSPLALPLWVAGLIFYFSRRGKAFRVLGWMFVLIYLIFTVVKVKFYFMTPAFMPLFAAGAVQIEEFSRLAARRWLRPVYAGLLVLSGIWFAPLTMPVLPVGMLVGYIKSASTFGFGAVKVGTQVTAELPQYFADRFGWDDLVRAVARVYRDLSPADRADCTIIGGSYGEAGAVDLLGEKYGLPKAISGHLSYYFWGPGEKSGRIVIAAGIPREDLEKFFGRVEQKAVAVNKYALPARKRQPVFVCREPKFTSVREIWPQVKSIH